MKKILKYKLICCRFLLLLFWQLFAVWMSRLSAQTLEYANFRQQVLDHHPLIRQADMNRDQARAALLRAKGGFDPKIYAEQTGKTFNGKTYFQYTEAGLKYPTWAGIELKGSYNLASGNFLNSETQLPDEGQALFGLNWTLGQGLMFDERRAGLEMAKAGLQMGEAERLAARNTVMFEAAKAYWTWNYAENAVAIVSDALKQAQIRHEALRQSFFQGERSAVDTLETFIQVQTRQVDLQFAQVDSRNAALALAIFLWTDQGQQAGVENLSSAPALFGLPWEVATGLNASSMLPIAMSSHPDLQQYRVKLRQLAVERKLKHEKRKPILDLSYNLLGNGWTFFPTATAEGPAVLANDVKWGVQFSYPLLNRKARGDWQITQIKIAQTDLELQQKQQSVAAKVQQYGNDYENLRIQAGLFRDMATNYRRLLDAELDRFAIGESSVFLVNTREQRWLDAQLKYLKLISELQKTEAGLQWAAGVLGE
ncbi:MAG: TolC family protein [Saprospiraceae bacterium]|nr:TolC family protein [Saprospiraceae bacterium]